MKIDFDVIRWRFLVVGFIALFFVIGATRHIIKKINRNHHVSVSSSFLVHQP